MFKRISPLGARSKPKLILSLGCRLARASGQIMGGAARAAHPPPLEQHKLSFWGGLKLMQVALQKLSLCVCICFPPPPGRLFAQEGHQPNLHFLKRKVGACTADKISPAFKGL